MNKMLLLLLKIFFGILLLPVLYALTSFFLTIIPVNSNQPPCSKSKYIFLNTNGIHLDIVIPKCDLKGVFVDGVKISQTDNYISIGWGDKDFYVNTPTWGDLTFRVAAKAMLMKSETLMHITKYNTIEKDWLKVPVCEKQLALLIEYSNLSFKTTDHRVQILHGHHYGDNDEFYEANGSYSLFKTCNTWSNSAMKYAGLKAALWTPLDKGLLRYYR